MKRKIFLLISVAYIIIAFSIISNIPMGSKIDWGFSRFFLNIALFLMISALINLMSMIFPSRGVCTFDIISPILGLLTLKFKPIYYQDLGYFYCYKSGNELIIYKQGIIGMIALFIVTYDGDIESVRSRIKRNLQEIYANEILEMEKKSKFTKWDGCLDQQSERDKKLNKIL